MVGHLHLILSCTLSMVQAKPKCALGGSSLAVDPSVVGSGLLFLGLV
jgi:hypothetical protein